MATGTGEPLFFVNITVKINKEIYFIIMFWLQIYEWQTGRSRRLLDWSLIAGLWQIFRAFFFWLNGWGAEGIIPYAPAVYVRVINFR